VEATEKVVWTSALDPGGQLGVVARDRGAVVDAHPSVVSGVKPAPPVPPSAAHYPATKPPPACPPPPARGPRDGSKEDAPVVMTATPP